ncbi:hypothetical protein [Prescottella agglutinans]|uniref:Uncharacterized protein n=1 Tax=Prescottella agglutinans TaxID=1644129 RepID=A0ABT6M655_9NOCA|nr:hypothetical protein [Prescottella agglutinans]MDH6279359.1 hypothetical protein [Prescottella agglutinans]
MTPEEPVRIQVGRRGVVAEPWQIVTPAADSGVSVELSQMSGADAVLARGLLSAHGLALLDLLGDRQPHSVGEIRSYVGCRNLDWASALRVIVAGKCATKPIFASDEVRGTVWMIPTVGQIVARICGLDNMFEVPGASS